MSQYVFITYTDPLKNVADAISNHTFLNAKLRTESTELSADDLFRMAMLCTTEFFYVVNSPIEIKFSVFDFSFKPAEWDSHLVHMWNNDSTVRLFNKDMVLETPEKFSDKQMASGNIPIKMLHGKIFEQPLLDIIFISYDEESADANYAALRNRFPGAKRSHGVKGIFEAHLAAAKLSTTRIFFAVDADAEIVDGFNFDYRPTGYDENSVHVWYSKNPINDLVYGYGGVKLFPTQLLLDYAGSPIDFTTSVSKHFKVMPEISNVTKFNTDPFSAWRSGFRECTKLASKLIPNGNNEESEARLHAWCNLGADREFGEFAIAGAIAGAAFGRLHKDTPEMLGCINNYNWLELKFSN